MATCTKNSNYTIGSNASGTYEYVRNIVLTAQSNGNRLLELKLISPGSQNPVPSAGAPTICTTDLANGAVVLKEVQSDSIQLQDPVPNSQYGSTQEVDLSHSAVALSIEFDPSGSTLKLTGTIDIVMGFEMDLSAGVELFHDTTRDKLFIKELR